MLWAKENSQANAYAFDVSDDVSRESVELRWRNPRTPLGGPLRALHGKLTQSFTVHKHSTRFKCRPELGPQSFAQTAITVPSRNTELHVLH